MEALVHLLSSISFNLFDTFVQVRLELAKLSILNDIKNGGAEELDTDDTKDRIIANEQLQYIATLARVNAGTCIQKLSELFTLLSKQIQQAFSTSEMNSQAISILMEQIHWLTLITAHVLADDCEGEQPMIPRALINLSASDYFYS